MTAITRVGLTKLFLWSEAQRFQTYPKALARLAPNRVYTRQKVAEELFGLTYAEDGKPKRENLITNVFGVVQIAEDKLLLRGINLFRKITPPGYQMVSGMKVWERGSDEWMPTEAGLALGAAYRGDATAIRWQQMLAEQLARYEPRLRTLLHLLCHGRKLRFETAAFFGGDSALALLTGDVSFRLFENAGAAFNTLLTKHAEIAVGPWWKTEIRQAGFELADGWRLEGAMNRQPSTNMINSALKTGLYIFAALGILVEHDGDWQIEPNAFGRHLSADLAQDLLGETDRSRQPTLEEWHRLAAVIGALSDSQGFIVVSEAVERWGELGDLPISERSAAFDQLVSRGIHEQRVVVVDGHPGQPRMGRGLFGDDNMRMAKLRILV